MRVKHGMKSECVGCDEGFASKNELGEHGEKVHVGLDENLRENAGGLENEMGEIENMRRKLEEFEAKNEELMKECEEKEERIREVMARNKEIDRHYKD